MEDARIVVSDKGDILSPKYAPEMIAPAIHPSSKPCAFPIPINAIPMVAIVVHELPVITEINAQMMQVDARKKLGWIICIP